MNSIEFVHTLGSLWVGLDNMMVSFDIVSLFTQVPIVVFLNLLSQQFSADILALLGMSHFYIFLLWRPILEVQRWNAYGSLIPPVITNFFRKTMSRGP